MKRLTILEASGKAAVIRSNGTGKSLLAFKLSEDHPKVNFCWLSPSRYIYDRQRKNLKKDLLVYTQGLLLNR